jgi:hypothetical protein
MPILVSGSGVYLFSPEGMINAATAESATQLDQDGAEIATEVGEPTPESEVIPEEEVPPIAAPEEVAAEVKAFMKWAAKGTRKREFEFKMIDPIVGEALNRCAVEGDLDTARSLAKAYLA